MMTNDKQRKKAPLVVIHRQGKSFQKCFYFSFSFSLILDLSQSHSFIHATPASNLHPFLSSPLLRLNKNQLIFHYLLHLFSFPFLSIIFPRGEENMSEFSFPPNTSYNSKKTNLFSLILSDMFLFCSLIISHPLYFSYFIFFSPYIIKILSFLSPLFVTTSLLLLALFTTFVRDDTSCTESSEKSKLSFLLSAYYNALEKLRSHADDANGQSVNFEDLEAYKIVFDPYSTIEIREDEVSEGNELSTSESPVDKHMCYESLAEIMKADQSDKSSQLIAEVKSLGGFLKEEEEEDRDDFVDVSCKKSEKEVKPLSGDEVKNVDEQKGMYKVRVNSQRLGADDHLWCNDNGGELYKSPSFGSSLGSFGSMRKEKEWRRTLACKLFEERHNNIEGSEGMDMLWETYEADSNKQQQLLDKSKTKKGKKCNKYENDDEEDDDEEIDDGQLCCLQALKFSAGKMNLGMGRPNLVKISKAFKGFGWLHNVTKHGKKIYH